MARQRRRLGRDSLHQAAVSANGIDVVVEDVEARPVVAVGEPLLGDGHAHAGRDALSERTGGGLDARDPVILGVPRGLAVELAKMADVVEGHRRLPQPLVVRVHRLGPGEMEHGPEQHRGMTVGEHEPIAVGPDRVLRIEPHHAVPDRVDQRRQRHRRAGVSGIGLLDRVHRERADGIDRQLIQLLVGHGSHLWDCLCDSSGFQGSHLAQAAQVSLGLAELGGQERLDEVPGHGRSHGPAAHAEDVHVIVLDALPGREMVVDQRGADARNLVGADRRADAAAADRHAAVHLSRCHALARGG